jgi:putative methyltransferase (TIGR04325 family)
MVWSEKARKASLFRVRLCAYLLVRLARIRPMRSVFRSVRSTGLAERLLGFRRPFPSRETATTEARRYLRSAHDARANFREHLHFSIAQRISDYPVIFFLSMVDGPFLVFDLGGNFGNLFYCYSRYLPNVERMTWNVFDLPDTVRLGARLARRRGVADRLHFTTELNAAKGADVFLASGSLHYFDQPLHEILAALTRRPRHVFVNRTPLTDGPLTWTVQDAGFGLAACALHNRDAMIAGMQSLGYRLVDEWSIHDMNLDIPLYPELSVQAYSGLYFTNLEACAAPSIDESSACPGNFAADMD